MLVVFMWLLLHISIPFHNIISCDEKPFIFFKRERGRLNEDELSLAMREMYPRNNKNKLPQIYCLELCRIQVIIYLYESEGRERER